MLKKLGSAHKQVGAVLAAASLRGPRKGSRVFLGLAVAVLFGTVSVLGPMPGLRNKLANLEVRSRLPVTESPGNAQRIVIFAPHPDDESLGCAGYLQKAVAARARARVVLVTNGEYAETSLEHLSESANERFQGFEELGIIRQQESLMALGALGIPKTRITFLGYPNHFLEAMWMPEHWTRANPVRSARLNATRSPYPDSMTRHAPFCGESMLADIETVLKEVQPDVVVTVHPHDIHHDHWPTYTFVRFALGELAARGYSFARDCRVLTYLIHRNWWPEPRAYRPQEPLLPPAAILRDWNWTVLPLGRAETDRKAEVISLYKSQNGDVDPLMRAFIRKNELFALMRQRYWPPVSAARIIHDPAADQIRSAADAGADIVKVSLVPARKQVAIRIETRGDARSGAMFHVSLHAGGVEARDRVVAHYAWTERNASGRMFRDGALHVVRPDGMQSEISASAAQLTIPWTPTQSRQSFVIVDAWTTRDGRRVDETAAAYLEFRQR